MPDRPSDGCGLLLTARVAAELFGVPHGTVQRWAYSGTVKGQKRARQWVFHHAAVRAAAERYHARKRQPRKPRRLTTRVAAEPFESRPVECLDPIRLAASLPGTKLTPADEAELARRRALFEARLARPAA